MCQIKAMKRESQGGGEMEQESPGKGDLEAVSASAQEEKGGNVQKKLKIPWEKILQGIVVILALLLIANLIFWRYYWIPSASMEPTLKIEDRIIVNKVSYWITKPHRGEIIVFKYPLNVKKHYIKRIIGLPQEKVEIKNSMVYIDDQPLREAYLQEIRYNNYGPVVVPEGHYFVLGDNRVNSMDSRIWGFVENSYIIGKVFYRYWPFERMANLNN